MPGVVRRGDELPVDRGILSDLLPVIAAGQVRACLIRRVRLHIEDDAVARGNLSRAPGQGFPASLAPGSSDEP